MPAKILTVTPAEDGIKLLSFLERRLGKEAPRPMLMRWMRTGQLRVDGRRVKPFDRLAAGQEVRLPPFAPYVIGSAIEVASEDADGATEAKPLSATLDLPVVYEDAEILVIDKPVGLPVQPGSRHGDSVATRLARAFAGGFVPAPVHRLDKATSGLVMAGKTYQALRGLSDRIQGGEVRKQYLVWVRGAWPHTQTVTLRDELAKREDRTRRERVETGEGREALARFTPLRATNAFGGATLLKVELLTGRTHQIRVQLASRGHAIIGDRKYGLPPHTPVMLLHAFRIELPGLVVERLPAWPEPWDATDADVRS